MAFKLDMVLLSSLIHETGLESKRHSAALRSTWEEITERYCAAKGIDLIDHKVLSIRWKNLKFYAKKKAKMKELGLTTKGTEKVRVFGQPSPKSAPRSRPGPSNGTNDSFNSSSNSNWDNSSFRSRGKYFSDSDEKEELLKEEIRQRMKHEEELFQLRKAKLEFDLARSKTLFEQTQDQTTLGEECQVQDVKEDHITYKVSTLSDEDEESS